MTGAIMLRRFLGFHVGRESGTGAWMMMMGVGAGVGSSWGRGATSTRRRVGAGGRGTVSWTMDTDEGVGAGVIDGGW